LRGVDYPNAELKIHNPMIKQSEPYIISISGDPNIKVPKSELTDTNTKEEINSRREEEYSKQGVRPPIQFPIQLRPDTRLHLGTSDHTKIELNNNQSK
jgi:hypothetical protein